ncbi:hypothetical protein Sjap_000999 [Stephania japonica]|uniref:Yippee domain-containing protein n=1 Tax=Stephania japonica TaxID=461633 RepID=A0AAP0PT31_9MAGN
MDYSILYKDFYCRHGAAYLLKEVVNVTVGEKEVSMIITGKHTVAVIFCVGCGSILGWKYEAAHERLQKYKEGKFILERVGEIRLSMDIDKGGSGGGVALEDLEGPIYKCKQCQAPLALSQHVVSKKEERTLLSGVYTVADVSCISCGSVIGWKYEAVQGEKEKYKEGKFILERYNVLGPAENDSDDEAKNLHSSAASLSRIIDMFQKHAKEVQKALDAHKEWMEKLESKVSDLTSEVHQLRSELQECKSIQNADAPGHV